VNEATITLIVTGAGTFIYWLCTLWKIGTCGLEKLLLLAVNLVGVVTGINIFLWAIKLGGSSTQNAAWAGITGVCMTFYTAEKIKEAFRCVLKPEVVPQIENQTDDGGKKDG
jgi:hypothetical protein